MEMQNLVAVISANHDTNHLIDDVEINSQNTLIQHQQLIQHSEIDSLSSK